MPKLVVASVQQQMRLFDALDEYRKELNRFLYLARAKNAKLVVFPALTGVMAVAPQVEGFRMNLLRRADDRFRRQKTLWTRTRSALAGSTADLLKVNFRKALLGLAAGDATALAAGYDAVFAELAHGYGITIVGGSTYQADGQGRLRHRATVYGPDGAVLGRHDKLLLSAEDDGLAEPGSGWTAVDTPVGRLGLLFGEEALYPEAGRVLAYAGADLLVILGATADAVSAAYIRQAALSRAQENQCYALTSFLVGKNYLAAETRQSGDFVGKSGIYAPLELTPRNSGVLVEMGTDGSEGLLTAELDEADLAALWRNGNQRLRSRMPVAAFADELAPLYASRRSLGDVSTQATLAPADVAMPRPALLPAGEALSLPDTSTVPAESAGSEPAEDREGPTEEATPFVDASSTASGITGAQTGAPAEPAEDGRPAESAAPEGPVQADAADQRETPEGDGGEKKADG
ncbi:MAG TPA: nitrilase-related carbon-nitrogen hydrolase [Anaerolineae bacterium]